ncbi:unnamed protein product [Malus baccata var. baccata]
MAAKNIDATLYDHMKEVKEFDESKMGVKGLSDSGITSIPQFFIHDPQTLSDLKPSNQNTTTTIPMIDLSHINSAAHHPKIVDQVKSAAKSFGFFQVTNHGVPVSVLGETPHETKAKYYKREEGKRVMYTSNNDLYRTTAASWHDSLQVWMSPERPEVEDIPENCREEVVAWDFHATKVATDVMELLSEGLGFEGAKWREDGCYGPLPELLSPEKPPVYRDFTAQEYLENFYSKGIDTNMIFTLGEITILNHNKHNQF